MYKNQLTLQGLGRRHSFVLLGTSQLCNPNALITMQRYRNVSHEYHRTGSEGCPATSFNWVAFLLSWSPGLYILACFSFFISPTLRNSLCQIKSRRIPRNSLAPLLLLQQIVLLMHRAERKGNRNMRWTSYTFYSSVCKAYNLWPSITVTVWWILFEGIRDNKG